MSDTPPGYHARRTPRGEHEPGASELDAFGQLERVERDLEALDVRIARLSRQVDRYLRWWPALVTPPVVVLILVLLAAAAVFLHIAASR